MALHDSNVCLGPSTPANHHPFQFSEERQHRNHRQGLNVILRCIQNKFLLDDHDLNAIVHQLINEIDDLSGAASQAA